MSYTCQTCGFVVFAQRNHDCVESLKSEVERLRAALRDVAQHYWWKDKTKDLIDELFAEQAGGGE